MTQIMVKEALINDVVYPAPGTDIFYDFKPPPLSSSQIKCLEASKTLFKISNRAQTYKQTKKQHVKKGKYFTNKYIKNISPCLDGKNSIACNTLFENLLKSRSELKKMHKTIKNEALCSKELAQVFALTKQTCLPIFNEGKLKDLEEELQNIEEPSILSEKDFHYRIEDRYKETFSELYEENNLPFLMKDVRERNLEPANKFLCDLYLPNMNFLNGVLKSNRLKQVQKICNP